MSEHVLLIGHGYVGSELARQLRSAGYRVTAISRHSQLEQTVIEADVTSLDSLRELDASPNYIIHCASSSRGGEEAYRAVFIEGIKNLQEIYPDTPILFTSSSSVYAQTDGTTVTEESETLPDRATGQILLETERLVLSQQGVVLRLSGIYGPGRSFILKKFLSREAHLEEDGRRILNQIHRDDAASAILYCLQNLSAAAGQIYNVSDNAPKSQKTTFEALTEIFQLPMPDTKPRDLNRKRGWTHKAVSNTKLLQLGWQPHYPSFTEAAKEVARSLQLT